MRARFRCFFLFAPTSPLKPSDFYSTLGLFVLFSRCSFCQVFPSLMLDLVCNMPLEKEPELLAFGTANKVKSHFFCKWAFIQAVLRFDCPVLLYGLGKDTADALSDGI